LVNNKLLDVTESLEIALRHLQKELDTLTLWIDAMCINQKDTDEKNRQIQQMSNIYQNATQVVIWLGPAADESDKVIDYLTLIGREYHKHGPKGITSFRLIEIMKDQNESNAHIVSSLNKIFQKLDYLFPDEFPITQYHAFGQRGWWNRVWVIQEYCLAREPVFLCGNKTISLDNLSSSDHLLSFYGFFKTLNAAYSGKLFDEERKRTYEIMTSLTRNTAIGIMTTFRSQYLQLLPNLECTLYSLLRTTCVSSNTTKREASDERDKIFALLGIACDKDKLQIRVEYSDKHSTEDVYIDTSRAYSSVDT